MRRTRCPATAAENLPPEVPVGFASKAFCVVFMAFMTGGLTRLLAGGASDDDALNATDGFVAIQLTAVFLYGMAFAAVVIHWRRVRAAVLASLPLWIPVLFAVASIGWSFDAALTFKRVVALVGTTMGGVVIIGILGPRRFSVWLAWILIVIVGLSALSAVALPSFGQHTNDSTLTWSAMHAGRWRGLYWHKNVLGPIASITFGCWYLLRPVMAVKPIHHLAALGLALITTVFADSAQALVQLSLPFAVRIFASDRAGPWRGFSIAVLCLGVVLVVAFGDRLAEILGALFDRDAHLSGRSDIWRIILDDDSLDPLIGGGYGAGFAGGLSDILEAILFQKFVNAHNGYLQQFVDLGGIGVLTLVVVIVYYVFVLATKTEARRPEVRLAGYFIAMYLTTNIVDNYALRGQDIYWFLMSAFSVAMASGALRAARPIAGPSDARPRPVRRRPGLAVAPARPRRLGMSRG